VIEVLANGLPGRANVAPEALLREHAVEVAVCGPQPAVNEFVNVLALPRIRIAADIDADHLRAGSAANNLASLAGHISSQDEKCGTRVAHVAAA
jgi:hypothetical protein